MKIIEKNNNKLTQILLIGTQSIGKTTIGKALSELLEIKHYDMDNILHNLPINFPHKKSYTKEEFKEKKQLEIEILKKIIKSEKSFILSTCAGIIENQETEKLLEIKKLLSNKNQYTILLTPFKSIIESKQFIIKRLGFKAISNSYSQQLEKHLILFPKFTNKIIYTKNLNQEQITTNILKLINKIN